MAKLKKADIGHVAGLSKLTLEDRELEKFRGQMSEIVDYFARTREVTTRAVEPKADSNSSESLRDDKVNTNQELSQAEALSGAQNVHNGYFVVKALLEK